MESNSCSCGRSLPLTSPRGPEIIIDIDESSIRSVVDAFYIRVRSDDLLGPIFESTISDWDAHMPKMYDFWSSAVLRTGRYSGRPLEAHLDLPGVGLEHYRRWIDLWEEIVREQLPEDAASVFIDLAMRMGKLMAAQHAPESN